MRPIRYDHKKHLGIDQEVEFHEIEIHFFIILAFDETNHDHIKRLPLYLLLTIT